VTEPTPPGDPHARTREQLSAYLDNELSDDERRVVHTHLEGCAACLAELETMRATLGGLQRLKRRAPDNFLPSIQDQIRTRSRGRFFGRRWMLFGRIPFEWVSLVMIIAMLLYYILTLHGEPTSVSPG
jgi:anti-sigma factor RsiW